MLDIRVVFAIVFVLLLIGVSVYTIKSNAVGLGIFPTRIVTLEQAVTLINNKLKLYASATFVYYDQYNARQTMLVTCIAPSQWQLHYSDGRPDRYAPSQQYLIDECTTVSVAAMQLNGVVFHIEYFI